MIQIKKTSIHGILLIQPDVYTDQRGSFMETYKQNTFAEAGIDHDFIQDNESLSHKNVLRGLHFQIPPFEQGKLVRVCSGAVRDVVVDLRKNSATYGKHEIFELTASNRLMLWIPPGFAHGFLALEDDTVFSYKCTQIYDRNSERAIRWNDPFLRIQWNSIHPVISEKDALAPLFNEFISPF